MRRFLIAAATLFALAAPAAAECLGSNLYDSLPGADQDRIRARADAVPFATGNLWRATRGGESLTIIGTYHFDDPRHAVTLTAATPLIAGAKTLLVEAGPEEERALMEAMGKDASLMFITEGQSLLERLPADTWKRLSEAMQARGIPGFMAAKFQPWYATVVLAVPPCAMAQMADPQGLDGQLIQAALAAEVPVQPLEPFDTIFSIFDALTTQQEIDMIESSLAMEGQSEDLSATLADLYFRGESRLIWELMREISYDQPGYTPEQVDAEMAVMEEALMTKRNTAWIPVIETAAAQGPLVVAFGALHLSGEAGVLNLLAENGWVLEPVTF